MRVLSQNIVTRWNLGPFSNTWALAPGSGPCVPTVLAALRAVCSHCVGSAPSLIPNRTISLHVVKLRETGKVRFYLVIIICNNERMKCIEYLFYIILTYILVIWYFLFYNKRKIAMGTGPPTLWKMKPNPTWMTAWTHQPLLWHHLASFRKMGE